jgi:carbamoyltransferase
MVKMKPVYTLGICNDETSSACLFKDGELVSAASEERFSRKKLDSSFPQQAIDFVLSNSDISFKNLSNIAYSWAKGFDVDLLPNYIERSATALKDSSEAYNIFLDRVAWDIKKDSKGRDEYSSWLNQQNLENIEVQDFYHHESHASSAALLSPFDKGVVLTADGRGDFESTTIWLFDRQKTQCLTKIYSAPSCDSLGYFYGRITGLLGFKPMRHEGKITGLAAFGEPHKALPLMKSMIKVKDGKLTSNLGDYYRPFFTPYSDKLIAEIEKFSKEDIAAAAQHHLEACLCELLDFHLKNHNISKTPLMLAGGVFGNVKATEALKKLESVNEVFVQPQMGDGGLCLGAAALLVHSMNIPIQPLKDVFLGPHTDSESYDLKSDENLIFETLVNPEEQFCKDLSDNKVIGLARGRMEFGPRALCNRSIVYKTSDSSINDWLNQRMNRTEFMPFAPVIRAETAEKAFKKFSSDDITLKFMTSTISCSDDFAKKCPSVTHIDQTARPQVVHKKDDQFMWNILKKWEEMSGEMSLVNTSFNAHEEPIVCSAGDCITSLKSKMIDILYLDNYRILLKK